MSHPLDRCGLATLDDLQAPELRALLAEIETAQAGFLAHEAEFRSPAYRWPRDPLHTWSRCWEYPYALHHLRRWRSGVTAARPTVVDLGSGVTFFPFLVAREGNAVIGVDVDPVVETDLRRAATVVSPGSGSVSAVRSGDGPLPFDPGSVDALYCISVLEHVPSPAGLASEVARVLRPGGLFVLTIDVDLGGGTEIGPEDFASLMDVLEERFERTVPERTVHPRRLLDSAGGPYPLERAEEGFALAVRPVKEALKPLLGRAPYHPLRLACWGGALRRKDGT